jgi:hypothetical protein
VHCIWRETEGILEQDRLPPGCLVPSGHIGQLEPNRDSWPTRFPHSLTAKKATSYLLDFGKGDTALRKALISYVRGYSIPPLATRPLHRRDEKGVQRHAKEEYVRKAERRNDILFNAV